MDWAEALGFVAFPRERGPARGAKGAARSLWSQALEFAIAIDRGGSALNRRSFFTLANTYIVAHNPRSSFGLTKNMKREGSKTMWKRTGFGMTCSVALMVAACGSGDKGDKGDPGEAGTAGATGANGTAGTNGAAGANGEAGAPGTPGTAGPTSFSIIEPRVGLLTREVDVTISAEGSNFTTAPTLDFGDTKIVVSNVQVVSATTIYAHLAIDKTATVGAHDVTIGGATPLKGKGAFNVVPPMTATVTGTPSQGGIFSVSVHNNDHDNFFDPNAANFAIGGPGLALVSTSGITATDATAMFLVEPATAAGHVQLTLANDPSSSLSWIAASDAVTVTAATPTALTLPFDATASVLMTPFSSVYDSASVTGPAILNYTIDVSAASTLAPLAVVFSSTGTVAGSLAILQPPAGFFGPNPPPYHLIASIPQTTSGALATSLSLFDSAGTADSDHTYDLHVSRTAVTAVTAEAATGANAHATTATAQTITQPAIVTGTIAADGEIDAYKIVVPANAVVEFNLQGDAGAVGAFPADQTGLAIDQNNDVFASSGNGNFASTMEFTQAASPATTAMYFVVSGDPNATTQTGAYTFTVRIEP